MAKRKIAIIGVGKIARDQHIPVLANSPDFELAGLVSPDEVGHGDIPVFATPAELYRALPKIHLVSICTPPGPRHLLAREALLAGKDVLLEKPPTATPSEFSDLARLAKRQQRVLFQTWHSRFNEAVDATRKILRRDGVKSLRIEWREHVSKWHPGQDWALAPGGFGVFDPGSNALSVLTHILPFPIMVERAILGFPANRGAPIDAEVTFKSAAPHQPALSAGFNWLESGGDVRTFAIETLTGDLLQLAAGGAVLKRNGLELIANPRAEYAAVYRRFSALLAKRKSDADGTPLQLIADAFLVGARTDREPFNW